MHIHWNGNVVILMKFSPLAAPEVVILTTSVAARGENFVKMMTFSGAVMLCVKFLNCLEFHLIQFEEVSHDLSYSKDERRNSWYVGFVRICVVVTIPMFEMLDESVFDLSRSNQCWLKYPCGLGRRLLNVFPVFAIFLSIFFRMVNTLESVRYHIRICRCRRSSAVVIPGKFEIV